MLHEEELSYAQKLPLVVAASRLSKRFDTPTQPLSTFPPEVDQPSNDLENSPFDQIITPAPSQEIVIEGEEIVIEDKEIVIED